MSALTTDFSLLDSPDVSRVVVGLSGGVDSVVLLDAVSQATDLPIVALHINHHLHDDADRIAEFCSFLASRYSMAVEIRDVTVPDSGSLEAQAREARYAAFEEFLITGDLLLLAHHADDQVETTLFRLFRGSRVFGLEGMPFQRPIGKARLCRPLLSASREDVLAYARAGQLNWLEDPTNTDTTPDRNFIRHELLPLIDARFPVARQAILAAQSADERARERLSSDFLKQLELSRPKPHVLELSLFKDQESEGISDLLSWWLLDLNVLQPTGGFLKNVANKISKGQLIDEKFGDYCLSSFKGLLVLRREFPGETPKKSPLIDNMTVPGGYISNNASKGRGLRFGDYEVRYRAGGEKLTIRLNRSLKNLFQENSVPPWLRARTPLIYSGDELVAVAGLPDWDVPMLVADDWHAQSNESGLEISFVLDEKIG